LLSQKLPSSLIWSEPEKNLREYSVPITALAGVRILVIDDDLDTLQVLSTIFSKLQAEVIPCNSARDALTRLQDQVPDLVICDIAMPNEDGYWFIKELRSADGPFNKIPVIALTAYASIMDRQRVLSSGFKAFVAKPVEPAELLDTVMQILKTNTTIPPKAVAYTENFSLAGKKILLVEDDLLSAEMFRIAMEREGLDFRAVSRSSEALSILEEWVPDIIVSDLGLPDEDGFSLIKKIRANSSVQLARVPAIALTGYGKEDGARALTAGFQLYQTKPIQPDTLIAALIDLLHSPS
jgi:CheY-like chemotaxis protein